MKKSVVLFLLLLLFPLNVFAAEKDTVTFNSCVDGDTAKFNLNNKVIKVRFLAIDTPETKHPTKGEEPYGKEASEFTCKKLKKAKKIVLEYDEKADKKDKYDRYLAWVFVDDELLQALLIKKGYAEVAYTYGDYKYVSLLKDYEEVARVKKVGIHSDIDTSKYSANVNNKTKNNEVDTRKEVKNTLLKYLEKLIDEFLEEIFN